VDRTLQEFVLEFGKLFFLVSAFQLCRIHLLSKGPYPVVSRVQLNEEKMIHMKEGLLLGAIQIISDTLIKTGASNWRSKMTFFIPFMAENYSKIYEFTIKSIAQNNYNMVKLVLFLVIFSKKVL